MCIKKSWVKNKHYQLTGLESCSVKCNGELLEFVTFSSNVGEEKCRNMFTAS